MRRDAMVCLFWRGPVSSPPCGTPVCLASFPLESSPPFHLPRSRWLQAFPRPRGPAVTIPWTTIAAPAQMGWQVGCHVRRVAGINKSANSHGFRAMAEATVNSATPNGRTTEPRSPIRSGQVQVRPGKIQANRGTPMILLGRLGPASMWTIGEAIPTCMSR